MNVTCSDEMLAAISAEAEKAGMSVAAYVRESVAWRIGRSEGEARIAALERRVAALEQREQSP